MVIPIIKPESHWNMPSSFPNLSAAKRLSIDVETCDPNLKTKGPGWCRDDGFVAGIGVAVEDAQWYFPIAHKEGPNLDKNAVVRWLKNTLSQARRETIFFNAIYDLGWLQWLGIKIVDEVKDPMIAAALLDEHRKFYNLDSVAKDWIGSSKDETLLYAAGRAFGLKDVKSEMWKLPAMYVGPYGEQDARLNIEMSDYVDMKLEQEDLTDIYNLELAQLPALLAMRTLGVRVDVRAAELLGKELEAKEKNHLSYIKKLTGSQVDIWSNLSIKTAFEYRGLQYPTTEKGNPSFTAKFLEAQTDDLPKNIVAARQTNRARSTFASGLINDYEHNGRIHCQFNQLRSDDYGTVSGRYSASLPNLQQIPIRDEQIGPLVRSIFLPEPESLWVKHDYSQQEPRLTVHYASKLGILGAQKAVDFYRDNPDADYHQMVADMAKIAREPAKKINLAMAYGMGKAKLAQQLDLTPEEAEPLFEQYHASVPYVKGLTNFCMNVASDRGYIKTLLGRRCRFNKWESRDWDLAKEITPIEDRKYMLMLCNEAIEKAKDTGESIPRAGVRRAFTYRAMNRLIQGSAADMSKKALAEMYKAGYVPHIMVHDEFDSSVTSQKEVNEIKTIMTECVSLEVPVKVDAEIGPSWGQLSSKYKFD